MADEMKTVQDSWAIVDKNLEKICAYDAVLSVDASEEANAPAEPIESGALASYNKIPSPSEVTVNIAFDGDYSAQQQALAQIDALRKGTETVSIYSPSKIWRNMALIKYDYSRSAGSGGNLLAVSMSFSEIVSVDLESKKVAYSPKKSTSANKTNTGKAQGKRHSWFKHRVDDIRGER